MAKLCVWIDKFGKKIVLPSYYQDITDEKTIRQPKCVLTRSWILLFLFKMWTWFYLEKISSKMNFKEIQFKLTFSVKWIWILPACANRKVLCTIPYDLQFSNNNWNCNCIRVTSVELYYQSNMDYIYRNIVHKSMDLLDASWFLE